MTDLDAADVLELLADLGARLSQQGLTGQVFVVGGAAMLLDGFVRSVTGDIDVAITASAPEIWAIARLMGRELGLQTTWLSTGAGPFIPTHEAGDTRHFGGLTVTFDCSSSGWASGARRSWWASSRTSTDASTSRWALESWTSAKGLIGTCGRPRNLGELGVARGGS